MDYRTPDIEPHGRPRVRHYRELRRMRTERLPDRYRVWVEDTQQWYMLDRNNHDFRYPLALDAEGLDYQWIPIKSDRRVAFEIGLGLFFGVLIVWFFMSIPR